MTKEKFPKSREVKEKMAGLCDNLWLVARSPAFLALIGVIVGAILTYHLGIRSQLRVSDHQKRQQVFSQLTGRKFVTSQLYVSRFEAQIYSDYHEAKWKQVGHPKDSIDLEEAQRWMHKSEDLALEIAKSNQSLFETIGLIRILFPKSPKLDELIGHLYHFKTPKILGEPLKMDGEQLEEWKIKAVKDLQALVETEYSKPIEDLLEYLASEISKQ